MDQKALNYNVKARLPCSSCCEYPGYPATVDLSDRSFAPFKTTLQPVEIALPEGLAVVDPNGWFLVYKWRILIVLLGIAWSLAFVGARIIFVRRRQKFLSLFSTEELLPFVLNIPVKTRIPLTHFPDFTTIKNIFLKGNAGSKREPKLRYLFLIERKVVPGHLEHLFAQLYLDLKAAKVPVDLFFVDVATGMCYAEDSHKGISIAQLYQDRPSAAVLFFSMGNYAFCAQLPWQNQAVLTAIPVEEWGDRELQLAKGLVLAPATFAGLQVVLEGFRGRFQIRAEEWMEEAGKPLSLQGAPDEVIKELDQYFSEDMRRWIAACAFAPELSWEFTLAVGKVVCGADWKSVGYEALLKMFQLPWFLQNKIPDGYREVFMEHVLLTPATKEKIHEAIAEVLEEYRPVQPGRVQQQQMEALVAAHRFLAARGQSADANERELPQWSGLLSADRLLRDYIARNFPLKLPATETPVKIIWDWQMVTGLVLPLLFVIAAQIRVPTFDEVFLLPGSPILYTWSGQEDLSGKDRTEELYRFLRYLELYALDEAALSLQTIFGRNPAEEDTLDVNEIEQLLELIYAGIYNQALELHRNEYFNLSVSLVLRMHEACQKILTIHGLSMKPLYEGFEHLVVQTENLWYLMGLNFFALGDLLTAGFYQEAIERNSDGQALPSSRIPNLYHLLTYESLDTFSEGRLRVRSKGKFGFLDEQGLPVPDSLGETFIFDFAYNFNGGKALVRKNNVFFYVDRDLRPLEPQAFSVWDPARDSLSGRYGFRNETGRWVIEPQYQEVFPFSGSLSRVRRADGKMSWIQRNGRWFTPEGFDEVRDFSYGYAAIRQGDQWGFVDLSGDLRIPAHFDTVGDFNSNYTAFVERQGMTFNVNVNGYCVSRECPEKSFTVEVLDASSQKPVARARFFNANWGTYYTNKEGIFDVRLPELNLPLSIRFFVVAEGYEGGTVLIFFPEGEEKIVILLE